MAARNLRPKPWPRPQNGTMSSPGAVEQAQNPACRPTSCNNRTSGSTPQRTANRFSWFSLPRSGVPRGARALCTQGRRSARCGTKGVRGKVKKRPSPDPIGTPGAKRTSPDSQSRPSTDKSGPTKVPNCDGLLPEVSPPRFTQRSSTSQETCHRHHLSLAPAGPNVRKISGGEHRRITALLTISTVRHHRPQKSMALSADSSLCQLFAQAAHRIIFTGDGTVTYAPRPASCPLNVFSHPRAHEWAPASDIRRGDIAVVHPTPNDLDCLG